MQIDLDEYTFLNFVSSGVNLPFESLKSSQIYFLALTPKKDIVRLMSLKFTPLPIDKQSQNYSKF